MQHLHGAVDGLRGPSPGERPGERGGGPQLRVDVRGDRVPQVGGQRRDAAAPGQARVGVREPGLDVAQRARLGGGGRSGPGAQQVEDGQRLLAAAVPQQVPDEDERLGEPEVPGPDRGGERRQVPGRHRGVELPLGLRQPVPEHRPVVLLGGLLVGQAQAGDGGGEAVVEQGVLGRLGQCGDRPRRGRPPGLDQVPGHLGGGAARLVGQLGGPQPQFGALVRGEVLQDGGAGGLGAQPSLVVQQSGGGERGADPGDRVGALPFAQQPGHVLGRGLLAEHGLGLDDPQYAGAGPVEAAQQGRAVARFGIVGAVEVLVDEGVQQQRVAAGHVHQAGAAVTGVLLAQALGDQAQRAGPGQRGQCEAVRVRVAQQFGVQPAPCGPRGAAVGEDQQHPALRQVADEVAQEVQGRLVGVADVLDAEQHRGVGGGREQGGGEVAAGAQQRGRRRAGRVADRAGAVEGGAVEGGAVEGGVVEGGAAEGGAAGPLRRVGEEGRFGQRGQPLGVSGGPAGGAGDPVGDAEGQVPLLGGTARAHDQDSALGGPGGEHPQQLALAAAEGSVDQCHPARAAETLGEQVVESVDVRITFQQGRHRVPPTSSLVGVRPPVPRRLPRGGGDGHPLPVGPIMGTPRPLPGN